LPLSILYVEWQNRGRGGKPIYCSIWIAKSNGVGVAIKEVLNAKTSIDYCAIPKKKKKNEYLVKAKELTRCRAGSHEYKGGQSWCKPHIHMYVYIYI